MRVLCHESRSGCLTCCGIVDPPPLRVPVVVTLCRAAPTWQVRSKKAKERMMTSKAQMNSIIMQMQENLGA